MRYIRYEKDSEASYGVILNDEVIRKITGDLFNEFDVTDETIQLSEVKLLAPVVPSKVVCVGLNYQDHAKEMQENVPNDPVLFIKPATAIIGPNDKILGADKIDRIDYEAELAIVINKKCKDVEPSEADDYILGYTCLNDVTARELQHRDKQWTRAKSYDTFCPIGPWIVDKESLDPDNTEIKLLLNGEVKQSSNTNCFMVNTKTLVSFISKVMTLLPGDVISTGTPSGIGRMESGDAVTVSIAGIGELTNYMK